MKKFLGALLTALAFVGAAKASVTLQVDNNGYLSGASGVNVHGNLYDVSFVSGDIQSVFLSSGRTTPNPPFADGTDVWDASQALLNQVFTDSSAGQFDSSPWLTSGCTSAVSSCYVVTPFELQVPGGVTGTGILAGFLRNWSGASGNEDSVGAQAYSEYGYAYPDPAVYAVWNLTSPFSVPEPSSILLMLVAGLCLATKIRSREFPNR